MLSRERAKFMVERIEKDLTILNELKEYISTSRDSKLDSNSVLFKIHLLKNDLLLYKTGLLKMDNEKVDCIMNEEELTETIAQSKVNSYEQTNSWDSFTNNFEAKKTSMQKVKTYTHIGKVSGL